MSISMSKTRDYLCAKRQTDRSYKIAQHIDHLKNQYGRLRRIEICGIVKINENDELLGTDAVS
jgi:hypothetical protein